MKDPDDILLEISFDAVVIHWRGPSPFFFAAIPDVHVDDVRSAAREASYGWGVIPVEATIDETTFQTSLFPRNGGYLLPIKAAVRTRAGINLGDRLTIAMQIANPRNTR